MFAGVTYSYFVVNGVIATEQFLIFHSVWALAAAVVIHLVGMVLCVREPRFFDLWLTKADGALNQCGQSEGLRARRFWNAALFSFDGSRFARSLLLFPTLGASLISMLHSMGRPYNRSIRTAC